MRRILQFIFVVSVVVFSIGPVTVSHAAVTCPEGYNDDTGAGVCIPTGTGLSAAGVDYLLETLMNWLLGIFGFIAVIAFVISGIQYLTAAGDEDQAKTAKRNMQYSIIGIIVAFSGFVILTAVNAFFQGSSTF